jgi:hypothetical protein
MADATFAEYGDDKRLDRQVIGRALLNDIGVTPSGAHGIIYHKEDVAKLLAELTRFGFFDDANIEKLPYWRNAPYVRIGEQPSAKSEVYVTVYRRLLPDGKGYHALFVVMNERFDPVEQSLYLMNVKRLLGGPNTLKARDVLGQMPIHEGLRAWWEEAISRETNAGGTVLMDIETGDVVTPVGVDLASELGRADDAYGPIYIPYHDFRVFLARHVEDR